MEYIAVGDKTEILEYEFLPEEALRQVRNHEALAVWAYEKTTPVCCAIFTQKDLRNQTVVVLQYIATDPSYQHQGMAGKLLDYARNLLKQQNISIILAFSQGDTPESPDKLSQDQFLTALGFQENIKTYQSLEYDAAVLRSDKLKPFLHKTDQNFSFLTPETRQTLLRLDRQMEPRLVYYFSDDTVSVNSLAYVEGNIVRGAIILDDRPDYQLCIRYLYIDPKLTDKTILLKLLAAASGSIQESADSKNILIFAPEERIMRLMEYFFDQPARRYYRTMYLLQ